MENDALIPLKADLTAQMVYIRTVADRLEARSQGLQPDDIVKMESVAYQIHNLYNATEDLLKLVATHFENNIADATRWHTELLFRMAQNIAGIRPALLSETCYVLLNSLRGFRHFFRHAYNTTLEYPQLQINLKKARQLYPCLEQDINNFLRQLEG